jgi:hypothetical protein
MDARFRFDHGLAIQFAQYILTRDWRNWAVIGNMDQDRILLSDLSRALRAYHAFVMHQRIHPDLENMSRIMGFDVRDVRLQNTQKLMCTFFHSLVKFYEENIVPFYMTMSSRSSHDYDDDESNT